MEQITLTVLYINNYSFFHVEFVFKHYEYLFIRSFFSLSLSVECVRLCVDLKPKSSALFNGHHINTRFIISSFRHSTNHSGARRESKGERTSARKENE